MSQEKVFDVGGVELHVDNRSISNDGGPSVRVYGDVEGKSVQLLRFDCFRKNPHYHYDPSGKNDLHPLKQSEVPDSIAWTIEQLGSNLSEMINTAGYGGIGASVDQAAVIAVLPEVESIMRG
jgi:hypothetical protein